MRNHLFSRALITVSAVYIPVMIVAGADGVEWPGSMDAVALVELRRIQHDLLASDVRRIAHGARAPILPYEATFRVLAVHPEARLPRLLLEGITASAWMPEVGDTGILALSVVDNVHVPAGMFPGACYLPEKTHNDRTTIEFPPKSGHEAPTPLVWEYLCDLIDLQRGAVDQSAKWESRLRGAEPEPALLGLMFLMQTPDFCPDWDGLLESITADIAHVAGVMAYCIDANKVGAVVHAISNHVSRIGVAEETGTLADTMLRLVLRAPEMERIALLNQVCRIEYCPDGTCRRLIEGFQQMESVFSAMEEAAANALLEDFLHAPGRYACIQGYIDIRELWQFLAARNHPSLEAYLHAVIARPDAAFSELSLAERDWKRLVNLARQLVSEPAP